MNLIVNAWHRSTQFEKWLYGISIVAILCLCIWPLLYFFFGEQVITSIYEGRSFEFLNKLIQYQHQKPLEHYLEVGNLIFRRLFLIASFSLPVVFGIFFIFYRLIYTEKEVPVGMVILWAMLMLTLVYMLNPYNRIYSYHGFFRASIIYQILNGQIPPQDFLFAGQALRWPWGENWLIAAVCRLFGISPFYAYAVVNIISLGLAIFILYRLSRLVVRNNHANIFSALFSIFGITLFSSGTALSLFKLAGLPFMDLKAIPAFIKFTNANGMPAGLVFFLLFVYATVGLYENKNVFLFFTLSFISLLGCGFIYTGFVPVILASVILLFLVRLAPWSRDMVGSTWRPFLLLAASTLLAGLLLLPYIQLASSGVGQNMAVFNPAFLARNITVYLFFMFPILLIIVFALKHMLDGLENQRFAIVILMTLAGAGCYFCLHFPLDAEYKFAFLSAVTLGIPGGIAFHYLTKKIYKVIALALFCAFVLPSAGDFAAKITMGGNHPVLSAAQPVRLTEKGIYVRPANHAEDEFYQWIMQNTPVDSVFVDTEWLIPVYAHRRLLFGMDRPDGTGRPGFTFTIDYLNASQCYDPAEFAFRKSLVQNIYGIENTLSRRDILDYLARHKIYVAARKTFSGPDFNSQGLTLLFQTANGEISLYRALGPDMNLTP